MRRADPMRYRFLTPNSWLLTKDLIQIDQYGFLEKDGKFKYEKEEIQLLPTSPAKFSYTPEMTYHFTKTDIKHK